MRCCPHTLPGVSQDALIQLHHRGPPSFHHLPSLIVLSPPRGEGYNTTHKVSFERLGGLFAAGCPLSKAPFTEESAAALKPSRTRCEPRAALCQQLGNMAIAPTDSDVPVVVLLTITARSYLTLALADCFNTCHLKVAPMKGQGSMTFPCSGIPQHGPSVVRLF